MFNLCKTVKIYQVINHYHSQQNSPPQELHQLNFQENITDSPSSSHHLRINTIDSHSIHPRRPRTGINLSIKQGSPIKTFSKGESRPSLLTISQPLELLNTKSNQTQFNSIKLKTTNRYDCDSPLIVESKITYGEMSPRIKVSEPHQSKHPSQEQEQASLKEIPLKREVTRTTQESSRISQPKIQLNSNPLKKSASFIRSSSISKKEELVKMSSIESSIKNSIEFKFSTSKTKRQDASESLLRLSCSSYSQIPQKQFNNHGYQSFSQTCSLQLKKDESCFLKEYVCEVNESIIIGKPNPEKELKIVKSNNDLLNSISSQEFKPSLSNIIQRQQSPVKKLKKRYGDNLLHPYDKDTIVSKSFASKSNHENEKKHIIDQSVIIEHQIENKFLPIKDRSINRQFFRMFLAIEEMTQLLVTIKQIPINRIDVINQQLTIYREMEAHSLDVDVSKLYQMYTHGCIIVLVKQPFELTLQEFIQRHCGDYVLINWEFVLRSIQQSIRKIICILNRKNIILSRFISTQDIIYVFGEWKLHSPEMFSMKSSGVEPVSADQAIEYLKDEIMGRIRETQSLN